MVTFVEFIRSKSGVVFFIYLAFAAGVSGAIAHQFYHSNLDRFQAHKAEEKVTALRLVDAFVTNYSRIRSQFGPTSPVPATFRAHSIESFNKQEGGANSDFLLRWVGRQGREIITPPADAAMAKIIEAFAEQSDPKPESLLSVIDGRLVFRTVYPSLAREQSCVACHNELQKGKTQWKLNDVMGAFVIDVPAAAFLATIRSQSYQVGIGLFMALAGIGLAVSTLHFRQIREREAAAARFDAALNNMSQGLCMFDVEQRLVVCNERYLRMYRLSPNKIKPGCMLRELLAERIENGTFSGDPEQYISDLLAAIAHGDTVRDQFEIGDGRIITVVNQPMVGGGWVATHEDITEQRRMEQRVAHLALHDALTDLPNRVRLRERLEQALTLVRRGEGLTVLCLDLDRFKDVNDTLGHPIGDALLKAVAERLQGCVRESDTVARIGGDEFAIIQLATAQPTEATALASRIIDEMNAPFDLNGHQIAVGISIGIAIAPNDGTDPDELVKNADLALYRAKTDGRGTYRFFEQEMDQRMQARRRLELDLRRALLEGQFELYYQPVVNLDRNEVTGCEALLRWHHPQRGLVPPAEFIPLAEETGIIVPLGEWVLRQACSEAANWPDNITVAVNLSAVQFKNRQLVQMVINTLAASKLPASRLELEITESVLLQDADAAMETMLKLREFGIRIAMDDFGTGYSSLSYLRSFPFDKIKIDRCFITDLSEKAEESVAILRAVAQLGSNLGMITTAEGVETSEQLEIVRAEGCNEMQGYLFSPPTTAREIAHILGPGNYRMTAS
jgi:diguanylate cyclase (GGDEF)-like protein